MRAILITLALAAVAVQGCGHLPVYVSDDDQVLPEPAGRGLVAQTRSPIPDVPMPIGFVLVETRSRSYAGADGTRWADHYYQGRADKADAVEFYRQELRRRGWQPISEQEAAGTYAMIYTKGKERLDLRINDPRRITTVRAVLRHSGAPAAQQR